MKNGFKYFCFLILVFMFLVFGYTDSDPYINTVSVYKISDNSVWLTGSVRNTKYMNEYGFAVSNFPFPAQEGQKVDYYFIKGEPIQGDSFTYHLTNLNPGQHYFVAAYYRKGNDYIFADNHTFSTARPIRATLPDISMEISNEIINMPISFEKSVEYIAGEITIKFNTSILNFKQLSINGLENIYRKGIIASQSSDYRTIKFGWGNDSKLDLKDLKLKYQFQLSDDIENSDCAPIEIESFVLIDSQGKSIATEGVSGSINYQYKQQKTSITDKNFNDSDMVYQQKKEENTEQVKIIHNSQLIYSRWQQAKYYFKDNNLPIKISREYQAMETKKTDNRPIYEESNFTFSSSQKKDLISSGCSLNYYSDFGVNLIFSSKSLEYLNDNNLAWKISVSPVNSLNLNKMKDKYKRIYEAWRVFVDINSSIELRIPINSSINKEKLRINGVYDNGHDLYIAPYYIKENKQEYACFMAQPNALFVLTELNEQQFKSHLNSNKVVGEYKTYNVNSSFYLSNSQVMIPIDFLQNCLGFQISYKLGENKVYINDGRSIILTLDSKIVLVNYQARLLNKSCEYKDGVIYISEEFLKSILNAEINYNTLNKEITIKY